MKVLWVTNTSCSSAEKTGGNNGTGGWLAALEKEVKNDIDLEIAFLSNGQTQDDFIYNGVTYHPIAPFRSRSYTVFRLKRLFMSWDRQDMVILQRLEEIIRECRPDILHIHGTEKCFGLIYERMGGENGCIITDGKRIPVVISIQGIVQEIVSRYFTGIPEAEVRRHESICSRLSKQSLIRRYRQLVHQAGNEARFLRYTRFIIGRTEWDRKKSAGYNPDRIYFHVGEIMRPEFYYGRHGAESNGTADEWNPESGKQRLRLITTFSDGLYKGYELLLKTAAELKKRGVDYIWTVIGYSPDTDIVPLSEKVTGLSSARLDVRFCGKLDAGSIVKELSAADIYCQVSHIENSPNGLCEALLLGLPAIATNVGGTATVSNNGISALLVPDTSPAAYCNAIVCLASSSSKIISGEGSRAAALIHHDPKRIKKQLTEAYKEILDTADKPETLTEKTGAISGAGISRQENISSRNDNENCI